jgi:hypothetical protein
MSLDDPLVAAARPTLTLVQNGRNLDLDYAETLPGDTCMALADSFRAWPTSDIAVTRVIMAFEQHKQGNAPNPFKKAMNLVHWVLGGKECGWEYLD